MLVELEELLQIDRATTKLYLEDLQHKMPLLTSEAGKFSLAVVRWQLEGELDYSRAKDCAKVSALLQAMHNNPDADLYDNDLDGKSYAQTVVELALEA